MTRQTVIGVVVCAIVLMSVAASVAQATVIMDATHLNGSFDAPDVTGSVGPTVPTGWWASGWPANNLPGLADGGVDAGQYLFWNNPFTSPDSCYLGQDKIYTIAAANEKITLSYFIGSPNGLGADVFARSVMRLGTYGGFSYVIAPYTDCGHVLGDSSSLQTLSYISTAADIGKPIALQFDFYRTGNSGQAQLDLITVTTSPVPEPATAALAVTGLIALLCYAWRKRK